MEIKQSVTWEMIAEKLDDELEIIKAYEQPYVLPPMLSAFKVLANYIYRHLKEYKVPDDLYEAVYNCDKILAHIGYHWVDEVVLRGGDITDKESIAAVSVKNWLAQVRQKEKGTW